MIVIDRLPTQGKRVLTLGSVGAVGLLSTALGAWADARTALHGYLFAFLFWLSLSLGALFVLAIFHATSARWPTVFRRPLEWMALSCVTFVPLFLPLALWPHELFAWVRPSSELSERALHLIAHKAPYLNWTFFCVRAALYFGLWGAVAFLLHRFSVRQDESGEPRLSLWQKRLAAGALPFLGLAFSFAALDWVMSLDPLWGSSLFAAYVFTGSAAGALATLAVLAVVGRAEPSFGAFMTEAHFHRLGTLLLVFVCLWAYCAYSQAMLIWIAGIPHESTWYLTRGQGAWGVIAAIIAVGHFAVPLVLLLFRRFKRSRAALATLAVWLLAIHALDLYWMVLPALHPSGPHFHWTSVSALIGVGGVVSAFGLWLSSGEYALPRQEPYLLHSLKVPLR